MKSSLLAIAMVWRLALPGYHFEFPRDFFSHPEFQTEWWYYTGNVHTAQGRRFGFELTFFRQGVDRTRAPRNVWDVQDVWMAHLAVSDLDGGRFFHTQRLNRAGSGLAGADEGAKRVWNGNWEVRWTPRGEELRAVADGFDFSFLAEPTKPPVIHGANGVSQKAEGAGHASYYFSETRLKTAGQVTLGGQRFDVAGLAWMDHEFFTHQLAADQVGWDWFSLQLDDGSDLMLYRIRKKDGSVDPFSSGTYVDPQGRSRHLSQAEFSLEPGKTWSSPQTGGKYPIGWRIAIKPIGLIPGLETRLPQQELAGGTGPSYWEGAIEVTGNKGSQAVTGAGYLEMTGYSGTVEL